MGIIVSWNRLNARVSSPLIAVDDSARFNVSGISVAASLLVTSTRKEFPVIPPNTQCPSTSRPLLYFLLPNFDSSISTSIPGPPICTGWSMKYWAHTSLTKLNQSTAVAVEIYIYKCVCTFNVICHWLSLTPTSFIMSPSDVFVDHKCKIRTIVHSESCYWKKSCPPSETLFSGILF